MPTLHSSALSIALTRRQSWIAFSRAFTQQRRQELEQEDDSGLSAATPSAAYGGRLPKRRVGPRLDTPAPTTTPAPTLPPIVTERTRTRKPPLLFDMLDKLALGAHLNRHKEKTLTAVHKERKAVKHTLLSSSQYAEVTTALKRHSRKGVREALQRLSLHTLFHDSALVSLLIIGMMQTRDIKSLAFYIDNLPSGVRVTDAAFVVLLNGAPASRADVPKRQRDQGRARRSYSLPPPLSARISSFDYNRLAVLINDVKAPQQALINVLPLLALQKGIYVLPQHTDKPLPLELSLACLRWLLRTGYDESAAEFVESVLAGCATEEDGVQFGVHALNLFLKALTHSHGDPAGPKFEDKYRPYKYYKKIGEEGSDVMDKCKNVMDFFSARITKLRPNAMTHGIIDRFKKCNNIMH